MIFRLLIWNRHRNYVLTPPHFLFLGSSGSSSDSGSVQIGGSSARGRTLGSDSTWLLLLLQLLLVVVVLVLLLLLLLLLLLRE